MTLMKARRSLFDIKDAPIVSDSILSDTPEKLIFPIPKKGRPERRCFGAYCAGTPAGFVTGELSDEPVCERSLSSGTICHFP